MIMNVFRCSSASLLFKAGLCVFSVSLFLYLAFREHVEWETVKSIAEIGAQSVPGVNSHRYNLLEEMPKLTRLREMFSPNSDKCNLGKLIIDSSET